MKYDLLIRDGEVIDPGAGLTGRLDVGLAGRKIVEVAAGLREEEARRTISAKDRLVTPGLIDVHAHVFVNSSDMGRIPPMSRSSNCGTAISNSATPTATR